MKTSKRRKSLIISFTLILVCMISFTFTTFAWFSDSASSINNIITTGNLDAEMYWTDDITSGNWYNIEEAEHNAVFTHDNYEPGYTELRYIKIVNAGSLAYKYDLSVLALGEVGPLAEVVDVFYLSNVNGKISSTLGMNKVGVLKNTLGSSLSGTDVLLPQGKEDGIHDSYEVVVAIALQMQTTAGNEYQGKSIGDGFSIRLTATQYDYEVDSFGNSYDVHATFPVSIAVNVPTTDNKVNQETTMTAGLVNAIIPAGVKVEDGTNQLTLTVTELDETASNVTGSADEEVISLDVHIAGVAEDNTEPMIITINTVANKYLNKGNITLYHVEDGKTVQMTEVATASELAAHNQFYYDALTGSFTVAMASFSPVIVQQKNIPAWQGGIDTSWYNTTDKEFTIYNGDQLAGLSAIVGGMAEGIAIDDFNEKTIKLIADIELDGKCKEFVPGKTNEDLTPIFYPIGYYNNQRTYVRGENVSGVVSGFKVFRGTFDGNGHKIANFYQNTWLMFGDYNSGYPENSNYYRDGMGLFGKVNGATIKNLRIDNFSCDMEFGISGVVATYANNSSFVNIAITNSTPGVYNNANGGIVGYVGYGYSDSYLAGKGNYMDGEDKVIFQNITVDSSNVIRALWGTWGGCCAGILGRYNSDSKIIMQNCHIAAQMDVFNDVCGNYQYYWYRYTAMIAGSIETMTVDENGYIIPDLKNFTLEGCSVHFGEWNDYYYCELVENTQASYTHDHQMSRLEIISALSDIQNTDGTWKRTGDFIIVNENEKANPNAHTCYHIRKDAAGNLYEHKHTNSGIQTGIDEDKDGNDDLKEDKQCIYLPFNQLFQGWGDGIKNIALNDLNDPTKVKLLDKEDASSVVKFDSLGLTDFNCKTDITLGELFKANGQTTSAICGNNVQVHVSYVDSNGNPIDGDFTYNPNTTDWTKGTLTLAQGGTAYITITDYYFCTPTTVGVHVHEYEQIIGDNFHVEQCKKCNIERNFALHTNITSCTVCGYNNNATDNELLVPNRIYLVPNKLWTTDSARFSAYFYQDGKTAEWMSMFELETHSGVYYCDIPTGYTNVIFCRMNPSNATNNWDNKWNQTGNLKVQTNGNNKFTLNSGSWSDGSWSSHTAPYQLELYASDKTKVYLVPGDWDKENARFAAYFFGNGEKWVSMTKNSDGRYECSIPTDKEYTQVIFCRMNGSASANNWNNKWNQTVDLNLVRGNTYTISNYWDSKAKATNTVIAVSSYQYFEFLNSTATNCKELTLYLPKDYYEFKVHLEDIWYGYSGSFTNSTNGLTMSTSGNNCKMTVSGGYYKFVFNYSTKKIQVTYLGTTYDFNN